MTTTERLARIAASSFAFAAAIFFAGCESSDEASGNYWTTEQPKPAQTAQQPAQTQSATKSSTSSSTSSSSSSSPSPSSSSSTSSTSSTSSSATPNATASTGAADQVSFGALRWSFGGIDGSGASKTSASIGGLSASGGGMSYRWTGPTLSSWGLSNTSAGAYACFFVQRSDGAWVGGKFDWISTSRTSRSFENILHGYNGWSLAGVPNPCPCAFVIVSSDRKKRTNVIASTWRR